MDYIFFIGLVSILIVLCHYPAVSISYLLMVVETILDMPGSTFYPARLLRAYLYASVILIFTDYYIASGLSPLLIFSISYIGITYWWTIDTTVAVEDYKKDPEFQMTADRYKIVWLLNTGVFSLICFGVIPDVPFISKPTLNFIGALLDYKVVYGVITTIGFLGIFSALFHALKYLADWFRSINTVAAEIVRKKYEVTSYGELNSDQSRARNKRANIAFLVLMIISFLIGILIAYVNR